LKYLFATALIVVILAALAVALVLTATAVALVLLCAGIAWVAWRLSPFRRHWLALTSTSPIDRLTDHYVSGRIDLGEFERRVTRVIRRSAHWRT